MLFSKLQKISYSLKKKILTIFGDIEFHKYPFFFIYNPKHYLLKGDNFREVSIKLQPFDVLLRRFDRYIDNGFIPGFWNHAAIYTPQGKVLHAVAEGVIVEDIFDFMKADHVCILRPKFQFSKTEIRERMSSLLGKEYDFSFDFKNGDRLSCTEVIRVIFEGCDHKIPLSEIKFWFFSRQIVVPDTVYSANFDVIYDSTKRET